MQLGFSRIKKLKYLTSTMNAGRTRTVVVTIGTDHKHWMQLCCTQCPFSAPMHGMAWPVLWLTTCCGSNLVPTLHAYSYIYMWRQWTGRLDQKCRTEACAGKKKEKKRKEKELRGFLFALGNKIFFHLASHAREMSGAGEGEHQQQQRTSADMED
jgi:hypothetical protein